MTAVGVSTVNPLGLGGHLLGDRPQEGRAELQAVALLPLAPGQQLIQGDSARPGGEVGAGLEPVELPPEQQIGLLEDLFRVAPVGDQARHVEEDAALVLAEELDERIDPL